MNLDSVPERVFRSEVSRFARVSECAFWIAISQMLGYRRIGMPSQ
jgi:hypothetical protein